MHKLLFFFLLLPSLSWAFRLDPMVVNIQVNGLQGSGTYTLENNTKEKVALQFEIRERVIDREGKETRPEAKGFLIYPEQMSLEPGEKRNVRVSWTGDTKLEKEMAYRFVASQLPIDFQGKEKALDQKVKLKFLLEYVASLYLNPPGTKPKMRVKSAKILKNNLELLLENTGTAHQLLEHLKVTMKANGKSTKLSEKTLQEARTENILPQTERLLKIPVAIKAQEVAVDVEYAP